MKRMILLAIPHTDRGHKYLDEVIEICQDELAKTDEPEEEEQEPDEDVDVELDPEEEEQEDEDEESESAGIRMPKCFR